MNNIDYKDKIFTVYFKSGGYLNFTFASLLTVELKYHDIERVELNTTLP